MLYPIRGRRAGGRAGREGGIHEHSFIVLRFVPGEEKLSLFVTTEQIRAHESNPGASSCTSESNPLPVCHRLAPGLLSGGCTQVV
jgi:hypothetical protein